jgi:TonB family protein
MRFLVSFVPVLALLAQNRSAAPVPQIPPINISPASYPVPVQKVEPKYTEEARAAGLQGTVSLYVEVDGAGKPSQVQVMEGLGMGLDDEAVKAVKHWEWQPRPRSKDNVQDALEVDVRFALEPPGPWLADSEYYRAALPNRGRYGEIVRPVPIRYAAPDAAACREAGRTAVRLTAGKDGAPRDVRPEGGDSVLADAAVKAVESWRFKPASGNGKTLEAQGWVEFECRPGGDAAKPPGDPLPRYRVGGAVSPPVLLTKSEPEYSERARQAKLQGTSVLYVQISREGRATDIHVSKRLGMGLDQKAIEAVKHWRFKPGMKGDNAVIVEATIEVNFRLL